MSFSTRFSLSLILLSLLIFPVAALAEDTIDLKSLPDDAVQERINFIQKSFNGVQTGARWWSWGWISGYSALTGYGVYGLLSDWPERKAYNIVSITKTTLSGSLLIFMPFYPRHTASDFNLLPEETTEDRLKKLEKGEEWLKRNSAKCQSGIHWLKSHILKISVNLVGGGIVWYFDGWKRGLLSAGLGIIVAEATILTQPTRPIRDYRDYIKRYHGVKTAAVADIEPGWFIQPLPAGIIAGIRF